MALLKISLCLTALLAFSSAKSLSPRGISPRIIGGQLAKAGEFPSAAAITIHTADGVYFCGGSLIHHQWILTAGQCVDNAVRFNIVLGAHNLKENNPNRVDLAAEEYVLHPEYDPTNLHNDIGLIKLRLPVSFTDYISAVDLVAEQLNDYEVVVAMGWGQTSDDVASGVTDLYRVSVTAFTNEECRLTYGDQITNDMMCAEGNYNQGTCYGDTGSALMKFGLYAKGQVAIASFFSGNGCESTDPSGFTRVLPYLDWIQSYINA